MDLSDPPVRIFPPPTDILGLTGEQLARQARERLPSGSGAALAIYRSAVCDGRFLPVSHDLSPASAQAWLRHFKLVLPRVVRQQTEPQSSTVKVVLQTEDGLDVECVRVPMRGGRYTLCVSTQIGCKLGCRFCETAKMGFVRNLSAGEIVAQVVVARAVLGFDIENIVFMGMGEPLDNVDNLIAALRVFNDAQGLNYGRHRMTVCTVGDPKGIARLGELGWRRLGLTVSLNAANQSTRAELMPIARRVSLVELQRALLAYPRRRGSVLGINYCLLPGINDGLEDAQAVARFTAPLGRVLVNVIPYNRGSAAIAPAADYAEALAFARVLQGLGVAASQRAPKGRTVMAACGQLGGRRSHVSPSTVDRSLP